MFSTVWTDGASWYIIPEGVLLPPGDTKIGSLTGERRSVGAEALAPLQIEQSELAEQLLSGMKLRPSEAVKAVFGAFGQLFGGDLLSGDPGEMKRAAKGMERAWTSAATADPRQLEALRQETSRVADGLEGPAAELAREVLRQFPDRLVEAAAEQRPVIDADASEVPIPAPGDLKEIATAARVLVGRFVGLDKMTALALTNELRPDQAAYEAIFDEAVVERAAAHYEALWARPSAPLGRPDQRTIELSVATVADLRAGTARDFPGGYARIAAMLRPGPIWVRWRLTAAPGRAGMAYDGLVRLPDRWVWVPKPWRAIG